MLPLNPFLHGRLRKLFGRVKVAHEGERFVARPVTNKLTDRTRLVFDQKGEMYRINCPYCTDTRQRLYVSHMFGKKDSGGRPMNFLVWCFNEACMMDWTNRAAFTDLMEEMDGALETARVHKGQFTPQAAREFAMPGPCKRLDKLPTGHDARAYVASRQFDPDRLARAWGVSYCAGSVYYLARHRLVVPIWSRGKLRGWQARYVGELDWKGEDRDTPKYFTCPEMQRGEVVCNLDMAAKYHTGVIVEGWFDVFGFGPMAVNTLGVGVSNSQFRQLLRAFRDRSVVLLYDPDVYRNKQALAGVRSIRARFKRRMPGKFVEVRLPDGTDPGSLDRSILRGIVEEQAEAAKVKVAWYKVETT